MSDILSNFSCLDELTQVIYQGICKFVVLSNVSNEEWSIHVGLAGREGRWWRGCWKEDDINHFFGSKLSDKLLETFAEKLEGVFIQGELCISDWDVDKGANIKFTLGPTSKKPLHIPLTETSSEEAAAYATSVFLDIALQAQSRKCKLYPSPDYFGSGTSSVPPIRTTTTTERTEGPSKRTMESSPVSSKPKSRVDPSAKNITATNAARTDGAKSVGTPADKPVRPQKGASLANPNKKARKYQAIEFESDDE